jgi:hypothetical protein
MALSPSRSVQRKAAHMKTLISAILTLAIGAPTMAQPANDNCASAIQINSGSVVTVELTGATRDGVLSCWNFSNTRDVWYTYVAAGVEDVTVSLCDSVPVSGAIAGLAAYAGGCGAPQIACSRADYCGPNQPEISFRTTGAGVYTIAVARRGTAAPQTFLLSLSAIPVSAAPPDACAQGLPLSGDRLIAFDTAGLTPVVSSWGGGTNDGWYLWTPTHSGTGVVTTCGYTTGNTVLTAYSGCGGMELACNDDFCGTASQISFPITAQTPVLVRLATVGGQPASGQLLFVRPEAMPPANDTCMTAQEISAPGTYPFSNATATTQGPSVACGLNGRLDSRDVYFRYTAPADAWITVDTTYPDRINARNTTLQILSACGGSVLACNDDADLGTSGSGTCPMHVTAGTSYIIRVASASVNGVNVVGFSSTLRVSTVPGPIVYARPAGAQPEPAVCGALPWQDDVNYGCNPDISDTFMRATPINGVCDTYYGQAPMLEASTTSNPLDGRYDSDWYVFTLAAPDMITVTGQTQFIAGCTLQSICGVQPNYLWASGWMNPECGAGNFSITASIPAGQVVFAIQNYGDPNATCGHNAEYWFHISGTQPCTPSTVACCKGTTCTTTFSAAQCTASDSGVSGTVLSGPCDPAHSSFSGCCFADFDHMGGITVGDIFTYLNAWFAGTPFTKFDGDGYASPAVSDIFTFLNAWFAGCA